MSYQNSLYARREGVMDDPSAEALYLDKNSKTADLDALARAQALQKAGADRKKVLDETNWFQLPGSSDWLYEGDDRDFKAKAALPDKSGGKFFDIFSNPSVEAAYPDLKNNLRLYRYKADTPGEGGRYSPSRGVGFPNNEIGFGLTTDDAAIHELQHALDDKRGRHPEGRAQLIDAEARAFSAMERKDLKPEMKNKYPPWERYDYWRKKVK